MNQCIEKQMRAMKQEHQKKSKCTETRKSRTFPREIWKESKYLFSSTLPLRNFQSRSIRLKKLDETVNVFTAAVGFEINGERIKHLKPLVECVGNVLQISVTSNDASVVLEHK